MTINDVYKLITLRKDGLTIKNSGTTETQKYHEGDSKT